MFNDDENINNAKKNKAISRRYNACGKTEYNTRTYIIKVE